MSVKKEISPVQAIIKELGSFQYKYDTQEVYYRFLEYCGRSIEASMMNHFEKAQAIKTIFDNTLAFYEEKDRPEMERLYNRLFGILRHAAEEAPFSDVLGPVHMEIVSHSIQGARGMFFTPESVSRIIASMTLEEEEVRKAVSEKGHITIGDPCSGGGALPLASAWVISRYGIPLEKLHVDCTDIDVHCCYCTYIQLFLNGIPAIVRNGNTLSQEFNFVLVTPQMAIEICRKEEMARSDSEKSCAS